MKYHITYRADPHPEGLEKDEIPEGLGACTAIIIGSILHPPDGSYSLAFISNDGRTGDEVPDNDLWKLWSMLAHRLAESDTLSAPKKELCQVVFDCVRTAILGARAGETEEEHDCEPGCAMHSGKRDEPS